MSEQVTSVGGAESTKPEIKKKEKIEGENIFKALLLCALAVVVVRSFLFEPFKIPSSSMLPTLKIGDHIFVSKFDYGLQLPFTKWRFLSWSSPKRGDIVVFLFPRDESLHYVKRVIGIPGDKVAFKGMDLYINGELISKQQVTDEGEITKVIGQQGFSGELFKETLDETVHYVQYSKQKGSSLSRSAQEEETVVPEGKIFVVGDNRDDSYDSRGWGFVPLENVKGRAQIVWLSLDQEQSWGTMNKIRWDRCGTMIH